MNRQIARYVDKQFICMVSENVRQKDLYIDRKIERKIDGQIQIDRQIDRKIDRQIER